MKARLSHWEQRKLALIHDTALAMSEGEWDALRWHFEQVWDEAAEATGEWMWNNPSPAGIPQDPPRNPYGDFQ